MIISNKTKGVIAAGDEKVAKAGKTILEAGGNIFDAAIAAAWAAFVVEPTATSAGGGGFMLVHTAQGEDILFDFFTQTPRIKRKTSELDFFPIELDYDGAIQTFHAGLGSVAVPGNISGLFHVHKKFGKLPMKEIMQPAIELARNGFKVSEFLLWLINLVGPAACSHPTGKQLFAASGAYPKIGDTFYMKDFADTLEYLAEEGADGFYKGEIARKIVSDFSANGGHLTMADFENYKTIERKPLSVSYRDYQVLGNPPPSAGGSMVAFMLKLLEKENLAEKGFGSASHLTLLSNAMRIANIARKESFDPHLYEEHLIENFFAEEHINDLRRELKESIDKIGSTTHFSLGDSEGNFISMTSSVGEGSGYAVPNTQIMLNNMLGEEDLNPHGFHQWKPNERITSMMSPTIILKKNRAVMALGTGGANRIRSTIAQVISNVIEFGMSPKEAIESPRIHWEHDTLDVEPGFTKEALTHINMPSTLRKVYWEKKCFYFGGVHSVYLTPEMKLKGFGDERRAGAVESVE